MKKLKDVSKVTGLSRRMIQEYEKSGLVDKPTSKNKYGHLQYDEDKIKQYWRLCFYREIGFDNNKVKEVETGGENSAQQAQNLEEAISLLEQKQERISKLLKIANMMRDMGVEYDELCEFACNVDTEEKYAESYEDIFDFLCVMADGFDRIVNADDDILCDEDSPLLDEKLCENYDNILEYVQDIFRDAMEDKLFDTFGHIDALGRKGLCANDSRVQKLLGKLSDYILDLQLVSRKGVGLCLEVFSEAYVNGMCTEEEREKSILEDAVKIYCANMKK